MSHHSSSHVSEQHISGKVITITDNNTVLGFIAVLTVIVFRYLSQVCNSVTVLPITPPAHVVGARALIYCAIVETTANLKIGNVVIQTLSDSLHFPDISRSASREHIYNTYSAFVIILYGNTSPTFKCHPLNSVGGI